MSFNSLHGMVIDQIMMHLRYIPTLEKWIILQDCLSDKGHPHTLHPGQESHLLSTPTRNHFGRSNLHYRSEEHIVANYQSELHIIVIFLPLSPSRYISHPGPQIRRDTKSTGPQTPAFAFDSYLALLCIISSILLLMSTFKQNSPMSSNIFRWGNSNFPVVQRIFRKCSVFWGDLL